MSGLIKYLLAQAAIKGGKKINEMMEEEPEQELPPPHPVEEGLLSVLPAQPQPMSAEEQRAIIEEMRRRTMQAQQQ